MEIIIKGHMLDTKQQQDRITTVIDGPCICNCDRDNCHNNLHGCEILLRSYKTGGEAKEALKNCKEITITVKTS